MKITFFLVKLFNTRILVPMTTERLKCTSFHPKCGCISLKGKTLYKVKSRFLKVIKDVFISLALWTRLWQCISEREWYYSEMSHTGPKLEVQKTNCYSLCLLPFWSPLLEDKHSLSPITPSSHMQSPNIISQSGTEANNEYEHTYMLRAGRGQHCQIPGCFPPAQSLGICPHSGRCVWSHLLLSWDWHTKQQCRRQNPPEWGISGGLPVVTEKTKGQNRLFFYFFFLNETSWRISPQPLMSAGVLVGATANDWERLNQ